MRTRRTYRTVRSVVVGMFLGALMLVPSAAHAVGTGNPHITSPLPTAAQASAFDNAEVTTGRAFTVAVDFSHAPVGTYSVQVGCDDSSTPLSVQANYDGTTDLQNWQATAPAHPMLCWVTVDSSSTATVEDDFNVLAPLAIRFSSFGPSTFYPYVKDGYRDVLKFDYAYSRGTVSQSEGVYNAAGTRVWGSTDSGDPDAVEASGSWNGRRSNGDLVAPGTYTFVVAGADANGNKAKLSRSVTVATGYFWVQGHRGISGNDGRFSTRGNCSVTRDNYDATANLDCWGGRYARDTFVITTPAGSKETGWKVYTGTLSDDICCRGRITKSFTRLSPTKFRLALTVTDWRASKSRGATVFFKRRVHR